ncbi:hypothetical protein AB0442_27400 [Kitasatospora sp. NPDC085895]|uniref:hypothetical protein n=1 Tax=Kitasatospora sp. NPDC085895 TaxID=3155057 RepID=UPI00344FF89F
MSMCTAVEQTVLEAQRQLQDGSWEPSAADRALARQTAQSLAEAVGPADVQEVLPRIERLAALREALAALAMAVARIHGHLAWFLAQCTSDLAPVLHWRALPAPDDHAFGAVLPTADELADAEQAVRLLAVTLARTGNDETPERRAARRT